MVAETGVCPGCNSNITPDDRYCQECGQFLVSASPEKAAPEAMPAIVSAKHFFADLSPRAAKPVVALPVVAGALTLVALAPWAIYAVENSYSALSARYVTEQATKALKTAQYDEAVNIMARRALLHDLSAEQRAVYDESLLRRAQMNMGLNRYAVAAADLGKVSSTFAQSFLAKQLLDDCNLHLAQENPAHKIASTRSKVSLRARERKELAALVQPVASAETSVHTTRAKSVEHKSRAIAAAPPVVPDVASATAQPERTQIDSAAGDPRAAAAAPAPVQPPVTRAQAQPQPVPVQQQQALPAVAKKDPPFAQKDLARYNELLAGYFSHGLSKKSARAAEPPTFKEWIEQGKPRF